ncbi:MAG: glycine cleavage system protein H [Terriglobales bacterium]
MSILFVLLTFLIVISVNYFYFHVPQGVPLETKVSVRPKAPIMAKEAGFSIPQGYSFHPGHTWVVRETADDARIGLDKFAADLVGTIDHIEVADPSRWIRQGQRLMTIHSDGASFDLLAPVEGVVMAVNEQVVKNPALALSDPYKDGWIAMLRSPDLRTNQRNLLQGPMVAPWMHYSVSRLKEACVGTNPALAQDGGLPVSEVMQQIEPKLRHKLIKEFFLN